MDFGRALDKLIYGVICGKLKFRARRRRWFLSLFPATQVSSIIDIGGLVAEWDEDTRDVTVLNLMHQSSSHCRVLVGDGRRTDFADRSFDLAYSNSVIEHVGGWADQVALAAELRRIGNAVYCQTPNRWFPFDVHYLAFFLHWYPNFLRNYFLVRFFTGWGWLVRPNRQQVQEYAKIVNLLSSSQMKQLFPDCDIKKEKFLGLNKSLIAVRAISRTA